MINKSKNVKRIAQLVFYFINIVNRDLNVK